MITFPFGKKIKEFASIFEQNGFSLYVVGGAIRDFLLNVENHDYDFCTDALPEQVIAMFKNVVPTGIKHGTVTVLFKGEMYEVTTFRTESDYSDKRHPDKVSYVRSLSEDLSRRDFTVNAFAANCLTGEFFDLFDGISDLNNKIIRAIGNPLDRFNEDALRLLRMCRFASKLNFHVDAETLEAACKLSNSIRFVSEERIFEEMSKLLMSDYPCIGLNLLNKTGLLKEILPELEICKTVTQNKVDANNVYEHIVNSVQAAADKNYSLTIRWALLLHDIGKPNSIVTENNISHFYQHEIESEKLALQIMSRLKFSNKMTEDISVLIKNHMVKYTPSWTDGAIKRFINRVGQDRIMPLFNLQWCDQIASEGVSKEHDYSDFISRIEKCKKDPLSIKDLNITGLDLNNIGIPKTKEMGDILNQLLEFVLDNPEKNTKNDLLKEAELLFNSKSN